MPIFSSGDDPMKNALDPNKAWSTVVSNLSEVETSALVRELQSRLPAGQATPAPVTADQAKASLFGCKTELDKQLADRVSAMLGRQS